MMKLIDAKTAAERTSSARSRVLEEFKTHIIKKILAAIAGVSDFAVASELYITKDFRGVTICWG